MKEYEDPTMELYLADNMKSGFDVHSDDDETEHGGGFGPLIG
jgi:hypothetical protein